MIIPLHNTLLVSLLLPATTRSLLHPQQLVHRTTPFLPKHAHPLLTPKFSPLPLTPLKSRSIDPFYDDDDEDSSLLSSPFGSSSSTPLETNDDSTLTDSELAKSTTIDDWVPRINSVTLTGRIGNDPEPKYFDDGKCVLNLSLAVKRKYHPLERKAYDVKYGEEETDWWPLEIWGRDAEFCGKYISKGARIGVTGNLQVDGWIDKATGMERSRPKIIVKQFDVLETKAEAQLRQGNKSQGSYRGGGGGGNRGGGYYKDDEDDGEGGDYGGGVPPGPGGFFD